MTLEDHCDGITVLSDLSLLFIYVTLLLIRMHLLT